MTPEAIQQDQSGFNVAFIPIELDDFGLTPNEFRIYCHLSRRSNREKGGAWPSIPNIAKSCGMGVDAVRYSLKCLSVMGFLSRHSRPGTSDLIRLNAVDKWRKVDRPTDERTAQKNSWRDTHSPNSTPCHGDNHTPSPISTTPLVTATIGRVSKKEPQEGNLSVDAEEVLKEWNSITAFTPARGITNGRRKSLLSRLKEKDFRENWREALEKASQSVFLAGKNDKNWVANIDWFIRPDTLTKILEGTYDSKQPSSPQQPAYMNGL